MKRGTRTSDTLLRLSNHFFPFPSYSFLAELRKTCAESRIPAFWTKVVQSGKKLGLIAKTEAKKYGGSSNVTDAQAEQVSHHFHTRTITVLLLTL